MRIAQIAPIAERVPPKKYGGTERVVHTLTEHLVKAGHEVTLFATADSKTSGRLISVRDKGLRESRVADPHGVNEWTLLNIGLAYNMADEFDIIHDHNSPISLPVANLSQTPVIMTIHSPLDQIKEELYRTLPKPNLVAISHSQIARGTQSNFVGTVHHGLDMEDYPFGKKAEDFLLFVGRLSPEKGPHIAIKIAKKLNLPLVLVAKKDYTNLDYFEKYIKPELNKKIRWVGEKDEVERNEYYSKAAALLHPVTWPEPFGLTMIEAQACGCPVIGFDKGSVAELVVNGKTGFVVKSFKKMVESVGNIAKINRGETRSHALENFNASKMVSGYETIYQEVLAKSGKKTRELQRSYVS